MILYLACTLQNIETDQSLYLDALKEPHSALETCVKIQNDNVQGECLLFAATEGGYGSEACSFARIDKWKEACFFEVIDKKGVPNHQAKDSCARTGRFVNRCVYHIIQREEQQWMKRYSMGQEQEMSHAIQAEITQLGGVEIANDPLSQTLVSRIVARRFLKEWRLNEDIRFPDQFCGNLDQTGCRLAYRFVIRLHAKNITPCPIPPSFETLKKYHIPYWEDDFYDDAIRVWSEVCRK
ncbi:MAG: hypothetical protein CL916_12100 [Deltaproteobacteria bacterium]|nr:hypothetical protein [Deltaproteobacteria bacterium]